MLQLHTEGADLLRRLDEGAPDIVVTNDAVFEGDAALLRIAERRRRTAIRHRHDDVGIDGRFLREVHEPGTRE